MAQVQTKALFFAKSASFEKCKTAASEMKVMSINELLYSCSEVFINIYYAFNDAFCICIYTNEVSKAFYIPVKSLIFRKKDVSSVMRSKKK